MLSFVDGCKRVVCYRLLPQIAMAEGDVPALPLFALNIITLTKAVPHLTWAAEVTLERPIWPFRGTG